MPPFYKQFALAQTPPSSAPLSSLDAIKNQLLDQIMDLAFDPFPVPGCLRPAMVADFRDEFRRVLAHLNNDDLSKLARPGQQGPWLSPYERVFTGFLNPAHACATGHFKAICFLFYNAPDAFPRWLVNQQQFVAQLHGYATSAQVQIQALTARTEQGVATVNAQKTTIADLERRSAELQAVLTAHTSASTTQLSQLSQLRTSLERLDQQLAAEKAQTSTAASQTEVQRLEVVRVAGALAAEKDVRVQTQLEMVRLQTQLAEVLPELERLKAARAGDEKGAATRKDLQTQLVDLQQKLTDAQVSKDKTEASLKSVTGQTKGLKEQLAIAQKELAAAQKRATDAASREEPLKARVKVLNQKVEEQTAVLTQKGDHVESLQARIAEGDAALLLNKQQAKDAGAEVATLKQQVEQLTSKLGPMERSAFSLLGLYKVQEREMEALKTTNQLLQGLLVRSGLVQSMDQVELLSKDGPGRSLIGAVLGNRCSEAVTVLDSLPDAIRLRACLSYPANIAPAHQKASTAPIQLLMEKAATDPEWKQLVCGHRLFQELGVHLCELPRSEFPLAMADLLCDQDPEVSDSDLCLARMITLEGVGLNGCVGALLRYSEGLPIRGIHGDGRTVFDLLLDETFSPVAKAHLLEHMPASWRSCFDAATLSEYNTGLQAYRAALKAPASAPFDYAAFSTLRFQAFSGERPLDVAELGRLLGLLHASVLASSSVALQSVCSQMRFLIPMIADRPGAMVVCLQAMASLGLVAGYHPRKFFLMILPKIRSGNFTNATSRPCGPLAQIVAMAAMFATDRSFAFTDAQFDLLTSVWPGGRIPVFSRGTEELIETTFNVGGVFARMAASPLVFPKAFYDYLINNKLGGAMSDALVSDPRHVSVDNAIRKLDDYLEGLETLAQVTDALAGLYDRNGVDGSKYSTYRLSEFNCWRTMRRHWGAISQLPYKEQGRGLLNLLVTATVQVPADVKALLFSYVSTRCPGGLDAQELGALAPQICSDESGVDPFLKGYTAGLRSWSFSSLSEWRAEVDACVVPEGPIDAHRWGILFARMVTFGFAFGKEAWPDSSSVHEGVQRLIARSVHDPKLMAALMHAILLLPVFTPEILKPNETAEQFLMPYLPVNLVRRCADGGHVASLWVLNAMDLPLLPIPATTDAHSPIVSTLLASLRARHVEG